jgi:hypothetical protein
MREQGFCFHLHAFQGVRTFPDFGEKDGDVFSVEMISGHIFGTGFGIDDIPLFGIL